MVYWLLHTFVHTKSNYDFKDIFSTAATPSKTDCLGKPTFCLLSRKTISRLSSMFVGALFARAFLFLRLLFPFFITTFTGSRRGSPMCGAALRQRGAFACKSLSSFFFSPPNSYLSSGGRREIEVFFLLLLLTYSATVEVSSSKMVKRESTQVENESGKAYHLISKVYPMTFVCRLQRRRRRRRRHRHASPDYKSKGATNFYSYLYTLNFV